MPEAIVEEWQEYVEDASKAENSLLQK